MRGYAASRFQRVCAIEANRKNALASKHFYFCYNSAVVGGLNAYAFAGNNPNLLHSYGYTIFTTLALSPNTEVSLRWWQKVFNWYNSISPWLKVGIGLIALGLGVAISVLTGGTAIPILAQFAIGVASSVAIGGVVSAFQGNGFWSGAKDGLVEGIFWSGIAALCSSLIYWANCHSNSKIHSISYDELSPSERAAYDAYSKNGWKGNVKGQTTNAGAKWNNTEMRLPTKDGLGNILSYREFDIKLTMPRGAERFVVSNAMTVYYTPDHYLTFMVVIGA